MWRSLFEAYYFKSPHLHYIANPQGTPPPAQADVVGHIEFTCFSQNKMFYLFY